MTPIHFDPPFLRSPFKNSHCHVNKVINVQMTKNIV